MKSCLNDAQSGDVVAGADARAPGGKLIIPVRYTKLNPTELDLLKDAINWYDLSLENGSDKGPMVATLAKAARSHMLTLQVRHGTR